MAAPAEGTATRDHDGFEIFYVPEVNGWQFRRPESPASPESYRSVFLARKAIDSLPGQTHGDQRARSRPRRPAGQHSHRTSPPLSARASR
jgi:hypothetical protein